jgi:hypothetical protein
MVRQVRIKVKCRLIIFFDIKRIVDREFVLADETVNSAYNYEVLQQLWENA